MWYTLVLNIIIMEVPTTEVQENLLNTIENDNIHNCTSVTLHLGIYRKSGGMVSLQKTL